MIPSVDDYRRQMRDEGYCLFETIVPDTLLVSLRNDILRREAHCQEIQHRNGVGEAMEGVAHHVVGGTDSLADFLACLFLDDYIRAYFDGEYILNSYAAIDNRNSARGYSHGQRFHRDVRTYSGEFRLMLNMIVMVDEFSMENGATKLVPGSHRSEVRPGDDELEARSIRLTGKPGGIVLFDSNVWHSAARNCTGRPRRALTLTFTRPFHKQQLDYPRLLGEAYPVDNRMRQLLGYNARVPASLEEWYQPSEKRMYKPGQG